MYAHRIKPGSTVDLGEFKPSDHKGLSEEEAKGITLEYSNRLEKLQERLYAAGEQALLIVLQGRDTAGKDGSIRHLSTCLNVQHTSVASFKQPTPLELKHDFLWRIHSQVPPKGNIVIFNRSHYEDVLAVRVHKLVGKSVWKARYDQINEFEELLTESGTTIIKFFLNLSKEEQEKRLLAREQDVNKSWKLSTGDWKERKLWESYTEAYEDALSKCSTEKAPWFVVPADHKWFRDLCITEALVSALEPFEKGWEKGLKALGEQQKAALSAMRAE